jgi:hypothetical protein
MSERAARTISIEAGMQAPPRPAPPRPRALTLARATHRAAGRGGNGSKGVGAERGARVPSCAEALL